MDRKEEKMQRFIKIVYESDNNLPTDAILPISDYYEDESYRENMEKSVEEIFEQGGFWLNSTTIIPYHRILSIRAYNSPATNDFQPTNNPINNPPIANNPVANNNSSMKKNNNRRFRRPTRRPTDRPMATQAPVATIISTTTTK